MRSATDRPGPRGRRDIHARVLAFLREPRPGRVKTRLAAGVGPAEALRWYVWLLDRTLATLSRFDARRVDLWIEGDPGAMAFRHLPWRRLRQPPGDLGERLACASRAGLRRARAVVLVGADCPLLSAAVIRRAVGELEAGHDAVLVPAEDGGYVLLGLRRFHHRLFKGVDWGSDQVAAQTRAAMRRLGWSWSELAPLWDLDRPEDLQRAQRHGLGPAVTRPPAQPANSEAAYPAGRAMNLA